jgi:hypothetical protein
VIQISQRRESEVDDVVTRLPTHGGDERDTAGVVLVLAVVEALGGRPGGEPLMRGDHGMHTSWSLG